MPKNVLSDARIELIGYYPKKHYPNELRLVRYWDDEQKRVHVLNQCHAFNLYSGCRTL